MFLSSSVRSDGLGGKREERKKGRREEGREGGRGKGEEGREGRREGVSKDWIRSRWTHSLASVARMRTSGLRREMVSKHSSKREPIEPRELRDSAPAELADLKGYL